ncbi:EF-hand domain-containing protein [Halomonas venusta]|uniref:EF-hand domain-containing protein n=1 Tax=Vreelandella venusta TaxID=44935 RepID=UPI00295F20F1|nr:EF-hand domain-containing protein [Halomonas venusta]MDW0361057.1 EF-hand domain-containing protein [Halomonas venusta]
MSNNLTLSVTLTGDGKQLSGTLKNAQGEVQAFGGTTEREGGRAERSLANVERRAGTVGRELQVLRRLAAPVGAALAGMFATRALQGQVDYADQLQKTNLRIGASVEALSQYNHVASLSGVAFGNLTTAWQRQTRRISEAAQGTGAAKDALEALGLSAKELNQLAPEDQFERIAEALQGVESQADRTALAMKLWDTEGVSLLQITNQGTDAIRAMREEADRLGLTISQDTADAMANYNDEMARFQAVATGVTRQVASELVPVMTTGLQTASGWVDQMGGAAEILDTVKDAGTGVAVVMAGRYVGAIAASQAALTAKAAIAATTTGTLNLLTGATTRQAAAATAMAGATRVAAGALALIGGPVGAAVIAAGAVIYFREELGLVPKPAITAAGAVDELAQRVDGAADSMLKFEVAAFTAELVSLQAAAQQAEENLARLERTANEPYSYGQGQQGDLTAGADRQRAQLESLNNQINAREDAIAKLTGRIEQMNAADEDSEDAQRELQITIDGLNNTTEKAVAGTNELTKSTEAQADALEDLYDRLIPGRRETVQLARDMQTLTLAMAMGTGNIGQNIQAIGLLQQQYIEAQNDTDDLADKTVKAAFTMEGAFDELRLNGLRRLDDGFADMWLGAVDGSRNASDTIKRVWDQTLAELLHMSLSRPVTVQLATSMGLNGGATGGGGFNGIGSLINGGKSLLGIGSSSTAAAAGGLYSGASTGLAAGGLYGNAVTGGVASTGIMSSITAGVSAAMPWIAGGLAIDSLLGGGITKAIGKLFGGGDTPFYGEVGSGSGIKAYRTETALGETGFTQRQRIEKATSAGTQEWAAELFEASQALDTIIASTARSTSELDAMKGAVNNFKVASGDASKLIQAQLVDRTLVALEAAGHNVTAAWGSLGAEELAARIEQASGAMSVMSASSKRLNLQFDVTSSSALRAADNMAQYAGGVQNLASLQDQYFQRYFSDTERAAALQADLTASLNAMGLTLPQNEAGFRALVEAQDQNTDAGGRNYVQLLQLSSGFAQLQDMLGQTETGVRDFTAELSAARDAVSTAEDQVRRAYEVFDRQQFGMQLELLELMGDAEGALALERERELATIDESLRPTQERIWAIQDEIAAQQNATQAARNYQRELTRVRDQLNQSLANVGTWLDQQLATSGTPESNLATAQEQLARQLVLVESGDRNALQNITQYAQQVLDANRDYNASSAAGQRIQQDVYDAIAGLPAAINPEQYLADEIKAALREQTQGISTQLGDVLRGDNPSSIAANLAGHFTTLAGGIDGVLTREQLAIVMSGKATDEQLTALMRSVDLNGDGVISGLESVIIAGMPTDSILGNVLRSKMNELDKNQLTHAQIRTALSPIATDAEIARLIREVDLNGDGMISQQELANQRLAGLAGGIGTTLAPMFDRIDLDASGLIDLTEFHGAFAGMASDEELRRIFDKLDADGSGTISRLEALNRSNEGTEANTDSMEKQARDQLRELNGLVGEMTRTTDQFVGLNSTMVSLREAILALGVAQDDIARIEEERAAAEQAERDRIERERQQSQLVAQRNSLQNQIGDYQGRINSLQGAASGISVSTASIEGSLDWRHGARNIQNTAQTYLNAHGVSQSAADRFLAYFTTGAGANADRGQYAPGGIFRTYINDYADEIANTANARGTITELNRQIAELQRELKNLPSINGSHRTGLEYVPFDGYLAELHRGEKVLTAEDADAMRNVSRPQLPSTPAPHFPLLGNNDIVETLRDLKREVQELRKENALLQRESNKHLAAANNQRGAAAKGQIGAIERGNRMLKKMEDEKRLEATKQ